MSWWTRLQKALKREKRELDDVVDDATKRGNQTLDAKERELNASAEEKLRLEQERAAANDAEFEALRRRIAGEQGTESD